MVAHLRHHAVGRMMVRRQCLNSYETFGPSSSGYWRSSSREAACVQRSASRREIRDWAGGSGNPANATPRRMHDRDKSSSLSPCVPFHLLPQVILEIAVTAIAVSHLSVQSGTITIIPSPLQETTQA